MISRRRFFKTTALGSAGVAVGSKILAPTTGLSSVLSFLPDQLSMNPTSYFGRMFQPGPGGKPGSPIETALEELGTAMKDKTEHRGSITAGYTYLGQFIDHDLTFDVTPLEEAVPEMDRTPNFRTPFLDLDHVYGGGPNVSAFLYDHGSDRGKERFLIGETSLKTLDGQTLDKRKFKASPDDLPRNRQGIALVGDPRQDENLILAQLHVAFLKLHNKVIACPDLLKCSPHYLAGPNGSKLTEFQAARRLVTWHYQWIVRKDYLDQILDPKVFDHVDADGFKPIQLGAPGDFRIPIEFSVAAFRFGHSMVRDSYSYNAHQAEKRLSLMCLLALTGPGDKIPCPEFPRVKGVPFALPANLVIEWRRFFMRAQANQGGSTFPGLDVSELVDTQIAQGLHSPPNQAGLPIQTTNLFSAAVANKATKQLPLPVKTLWRGSRVGLPTGQDVVKEIMARLGTQLCQKLGIVSLEPAELTNNPRDAAILQKYGFDTKTPLWYYLLKESELRHSGHRLGPVGSLIVGNVIIGALYADPNSYVTVAGENSTISSKDKWWQPTLPGVEGSVGTNSVSYGMSDLLRFILGVDPCSQNLAGHHSG